jgi:putative membrane protein
MLPNYLSTLPHVLSYLAMGLLLLSVFWSIYTYLTPHDEVEMINAGNLSATVALLGALLGFTLPVAAAILKAVSTMALVQWGVIALLVQLGVYAATRLLLPGLHQALIDDKPALPLLAAGLSVLGGIINAASMSF